MATSTALEPRKIDISLIVASIKAISFLDLFSVQYALSQLYTNMYSMNHFFIQFHYGHTPFSLVISYCKHTE